MNYDRDAEWVKSIAATFTSYRRMIDGAIAQLSDEELCRRSRPDTNSVAVILRHLGGNLLSRWTDFLTTDGEKPDRNRDREFQDWQGNRDSLVAYFNSGWDILMKALAQIDAKNIESAVYIRGERHSVADAVLRSLAHVSYHAGQIMLVARMVHAGSWDWLTIAPGGSAQHNRQTWGTSASRSVLGEGAE